MSASPDSLAPARAFSPLDQALRRIERKGEVPIWDVRAMYRDVLGGDQVVEGLLSKGYAKARDGVLTITEAGRRRLADV